MMNPVFLFCVALLGAPAEPPAAPVASVTASGETEPVSDVGDAADDPAIWIHPTNPAASLILGTNKKSGLGVYNLDGKQLQFLRAGKLNNVDVRQGVLTSTGRRVDLAAASRRDARGISLFFIETRGDVTTLRELPGSPATVTIQEPYGFCMYKPADQPGVHCLVNDKTGKVEEWRVEIGEDERPSLTLVCTRKLETQVEGMVADDETNTLFVSEEDTGIWKFPLGSGDATKGQLIAKAGEHIVPDAEGLAIARTGRDDGYLICSSQGDSTFAVFDRKPPHAFVRSVRITAGQFGAVEETDGIEVCLLPLGPRYPHGVFVAQDGINSPGQNFKIVEWPRFAETLTPAK